MTTYALPIDLAFARLKSIKSSPAASGDDLAWLATLASLALKARLNFGPGNDPDWWARFTKATGVSPDDIYSVAPFTFDGLAITIGPGRLGKVAFESESSFPLLPDCEQWLVFRDGIGVGIANVAVEGSLLRIVTNAETVSVVEDLT